jgi:hypothetical protein
MMWKNVAMEKLRNTTKYILGAWICVNTGDITALSFSLKFHEMLSDCTVSKVTQFHRPDVMMTILYYQVPCY